MPTQDNVLIVLTNYFPVRAGGRGGVSELKLSCAKDGTDFQPGEGLGKKERCGEAAALPPPASRKPCNTGP